MKVSTAWNTEAPLLGGLSEFDEAARTWLQKHAPQSFPSDPDDLFDARREWQRTLADAGWLGLSWPEVYGGQGLTILHEIRFNDLLSALRLPAPAGVIGLGVVGPTVLSFSSEQQKRTLLPPMLTGEDIWCLGFSEPEAGSDLAALRTKAVDVDGGFSVTGQKVWTSWADKATKSLVLVRSAKAEKKHEGLTLLAIEMDEPGIQLQPIRQITEQQEFFEVHFEDVFVPLSAVIGERERGWNYVVHSLSQERGRNMFRRLAELDVAYQDFVDEFRHARENGEQMRAHEGPRHFAEAQIWRRLGRSRILLDALRAQANLTAARLSRSPDTPHPEDSLDKLWLEKTEQHLYHTIMELVRHRRPLRQDPQGEIDMERWVRDYLYSRAASLYAGTTQIQKNLLAKRLLDLPAAP